MSRKNASQETGAEKQKKGVRSYFQRLFERYLFRDEKQFAKVGKGLLFSVLLLLCAFMLLEVLAGALEEGVWFSFFCSLILCGTLTLCQGLRLFAVRYGATKNVLHALSFVCSGAFLMIVDGFYPVAFYMLVLTSFYADRDKIKSSLYALMIAFLLYASVYVCRLYIRVGFDLVETFDVLRQTFSALFTLTIHFVIVQVSLAFYRQFLRLQRALTLLDASKQELEKAYAVAKEVSALEERQRIAKEIHDTAGHSLTTVIMQTEGAKRILDTEPEEAKKKIVAANLQAKHALEELRNSVHLLSGNRTGETLKSAMESIIHESTDGTGLIIRSEIEDLLVSPAKSRFLCNSLKEGISNGLRHGGATAFWFEMKKEDDGKLKFLLSDNGKGIEGKLIKPGFGLITMRDRARSFGGEVYYSAEEGFEIRIEMPIDR